MTTRRPLRLAPALLAVALAAAACTDSSGDDAGPDTTDLDSGQIQLTAGLETVDSCEALLERLKTEALERVGPYGFDQGGGPVPLIMEDMAAEESAAGSDGVTTAAPADAGDESSRAAGAADGDAAVSTEAGFSGTNNQEVDVDEADIVKTDGERLVIANGTTLRVIDATAETPTITGTIELPEDAYGGQLFLDGDRALLMTTGWADTPFLREGDAKTTWFPGTSTARLTTIDLVSGEITRTVEFEGSYLSAREVDGSVRVVLTTMPSRFAFVYPSNESAADSAEESNRQIIEDSTIEQWIPTYRVTEGDEVTEGPIVDCDKVHLPSEFAGFGSLVILTADAGEDFAIEDTAAVLTDAQTVYASTDRLAVATPRWPEWTEDGEVVEDDSYTTAIHTFDITSADSATYVASGAVRGHLLNQYSLSEADGRLRVATTDGSPWFFSDEQTPSESFVTVLEEDDGSLVQVGQVGGLGEGEQIQAVRFVGDTGYVVTFRQTDPLYVIDLSDPTNPTMTGELKIPGFSSYLHPVDETHLVGVGTDGDEQGATFGSVISLFDVADPTNPTLVTKLNFDEASGRTPGSSSSPVSWDAKAFTWWEGTAIVPVSWWSYDEADQTGSNGSEAVLVAVDPAAGTLTEIGRVTHPVTEQCDQPIDLPRPIEPDGAPATEAAGTDDAEADLVEAEPAETTEPVEGDVIEPYDPGQPTCWTWVPEITRSVVIGDNLFTLSEAGVKVSRYDGLAEVTWLPFTAS